MATAPQIPPFVLVMSTNPYREGQYGRAGLRFSRAWRVLKVDETENLEDGVISPATLARLNADTFLAVKPASQADVDAYTAELALGGGDKDATIEALKAKNADLEARMMRLEQAASKPTGKGDPKGDSKQ